ncbi:MAG TPA: protein BatD [Gammaproteobacteria bacterium]|nr:protein BatD [Gammaproteobacteria bacterium]
MPKTMNLKNPFRLRRHSIGESWLHPRPALSFPRRRESRATVWIPGLRSTQPGMTESVGWIKRSGSTGGHTLLLALLLVLPIPNAFAAVKAWLNQNPVYVGDPVVLTISVDGNTSGNPDLAPLKKDFRILGSGSSSNVSIINGVTSSTRSWTIRLQPLKQGRITLPALTVGNEKTPPLTLTVADVPPQVKAQQREHVQIEVDTGNGNRSVYVQQQIPFTIKLLTDGTILSGDLQPLQVDNAVVEQITRDKQYQITRNGKTWNVLERRYVISPQRSGKLTIPSVIFKGTRRQQTRQRRSGNPFDGFLGRDPFFNDPFADDFFAGTPFGPRGKPIQSASEPVSIQVKPIPPEYKSKNWLPAESVELTDSWANNPPEFHVGEPAVRSLKLQVKGLAGSQIPPIDPGKPDNISLYTDKNNTDTRTDGQTIYGISEQTYTYMPQKAGKMTIPAIRIDWWNTQTGQQETTTLPARAINVLPGAGGVTQTATPRQQTQATAKTAPTTSVKTQPAKTTPATKKTSQTPWPLIITGIILALALLALVFFRRGDKTQPQTPGKPQPKPQTGNSEKEALKALTAACQSGDAPAIAKALIKLGQATWPDNPPMSLGQLAERVQEGREALQELDRFLYGNGSRERFDTTALCRLFKSGLKSSAGNNLETEKPLMGIYPER